MNKRNIELKVSVKLRGDHNLVVGYALPTDYTVIGQSQQILELSQSLLRNGPTPPGRILAHPRHYHRLLRFS